jgi:hypothetical protein
VTIELEARRAIVLCLAVAGAALSTPASARAQEVPDASCPGPGEGVTSTSGNNRLAQTFTAQTTGGLTRAQVTVVRNIVSTDWIVQILAVDGTGTPTDTVLASATVPDASVPMGDSTLDVTFPTPAPVVAGQQYAVAVTRPGSTQLDVRIRTGNVCEGRFFASSLTGFNEISPNFDMVFAVFVEPAPPPPEPEPQIADLNAPSATLTSGPKDKTKKKKATFTFTGADTRAVAGFQCSLDGAAFTPCASPHTVKVKKGKHTFQVRAVDQAGNVGTPASDSWKRKKKRSERGP